MSKDHYYRAFLISKYEDLELDRKRQPNSCFANNYFDDDLNLGRHIWRYNHIYESVILKNRRTMFPSHKTSI